MYSALTKTQQLSLARQGKSCGKNQWYYACLLQDRIAFQFSICVGLSEYQYFRAFFHLLPFATKKPNTLLYRGIRLFFPVLSVDVFYMVFSPCRNLTSTSGASDIGSFSWTSGCPLRSAFLITDESGNMATGISPSVS